MRLFLISLFLSLNLFTTTSVLAQERLIFAIDVIRHGDRTPTADIPKAPHHWKEGLGQLTARGMQQEYILGANLRKDYIKKYHLLPENYAVGTIYARSSDVDRTLMSAQSFFMGLYPLGTGPDLPDSKKPALPHSFQSIPIHTVAKDQENLLIAWTESPKFSEYLKMYVYPTPEWKQKTNEMIPKFAKWSESTGIKITDLFQLKSLGDTLYIDQLYNVPLPEGLSSEEAQEIIDTGRWVFVTAFKSLDMGKNTGSGLLKTISDYLQDASTGKTQLKYLLLSSHDTTQLSLMSAMATPLKEVPPYASDLNFSLFENGKQNFYVRVKFNEKQVIIPGCHNSDTCSLAEFSALVK